MYPHRAGYTWRRKRPFLAERLDYSFISNSMLQFVKKVEILPSICADHSLVLIDIDFNPNKRGQGYWKINNSLLKDKDYVDKMNLLIEKELAQADMYSSKKDHWEILKLSIRTSTLQFSSNRQKSKKNKLLILERKLNYWMEEGDREQLSSDLVNSRIAELSREVKQIHTERAEGAVMRCRQKWAELAEKPTKYFLNLEKHNFNKKTIHRIRTPDGIISDSKGIKEHLTKFYHSLLTTKIKMDESFTEGLEIPQISDECKNEIEKPITQAEIGKALRDLNSYKCPGCDGLSAGFYKMFYPKLKTFLYELFNEVVGTGKMHLSARRGIITLLEKTGRDPLEIGNWRPISLLCTDYKIFAKIIACRLQLVITQIVHPSQTGFVKGKNISENTLKLLSMMDFYTETNSSAVVISFDFYKAFDSVEWDPIYFTMKKFGIGPYMIDLVKILHNEMYSTVLNNGFWGNWIKLTRSTRQGCPASPAIFLLIAETLGLKIRQTVEIKGLQIADTEYKSVQYADDIWVILIPTEENINKALQIMIDFYRFSGLNINFEKTTAFKLGPIRDVEAKYYTIRKLNWTLDPVKILGIWLHPNKQVLIHKNFEEKLHKIRDILALWSRRKLSVMGRITIINTLVISQFNYQLAALPTPPQHFFKKFRDLILDFLWDKKPHKIRYDKIIQDYSDHGLKLVDIKAREIALKAKWPIYFADRHEPFLYWSAPVKDHRIWQANIEKKHIKILSNQSNRCNTVFTDIWSAWSEIHFEIPQNRQEISSQLLWGNSLILRAGLPFFQNEIVNAHVDRIEDLYHKDGSFLAYSELPEYQKGKISIMLFNALKSALPPVWRSFQSEEINSNNSNETFMTKFEQLERVKFPTKKFYWEIIAKSKTMASPPLSLIKELEVNITAEQWQKTFIDIFSVTNSTKLRMFHYQILNGILTTNVRRAKYTKNLSPNCMFCKTHKETVVHLLIECMYSRKLWRALQKWVKFYLKCTVRYSKEEILLNNYDGPNKSLINTMILVMKRYIYVAKCFEEKLTFIKFLTMLNQTYRIETLTASLNDKIVKHNKKWKNYINNM